MECYGRKLADMNCYELIWAEGKPLYWSSEDRREWIQIARSGPDDPNYPIQGPWVLPYNTIPLYTASCHAWDPRILEPARIPGTLLTHRQRRPPRLCLRHLGYVKLDKMCLRLSRRQKGCRSGNKTKKVLKIRVHFREEPSIHNLLL